eukprot:363681_1
MLKLLLILSLFAISFATNCSSITQCTDDHYCMKRQAILLTTTANEYSCEPSNLCKILTHGTYTCQKMNLTNVISYYADNDSCNSNTPLKVPIKLDMGIDCCSTKNCSTQFNQTIATNCATFNSKLSDVIDKVINCYIPDNIMTHVQCNKSETCSATLQNHINNYPNCACKALFDYLGVEGYDYLSIVSNWVQQYVGEMLDEIQIGDFVKKCGGLQLDCFPLIADCRVNTGDSSIEYDNQCIEDVYLHLDDTLDDKTTSRYVKSNLKPNIVIIIIVVSVVGGICTCILSCYLVNESYSRYKKRMQQQIADANVNTVGAFNSMERVKTDSDGAIIKNDKLKSDGEMDNNDNSVTEEVHQVEGFTNHTKYESAVHLNIVNSIEKNDDDIDVQKECNDEKKTEQNENKTEDNIDEKVQNEGMKTETTSPNELYEISENKEDILLDEMLSDILKMESLDPNKIHEMNVNNVIDKQNNDSDSENSDNMYE